MNKIIILFTIVYSIFIAAIGCDKENDVSNTSKIALLMAIEESREIVDCYYPDDSCEGNIKAGSCPGEIKPVGWCTLNGYNDCRTLPETDIVKCYKP